MRLFDRIYGCLAGMALGDALGMPTEFLTPERIQAALGWVDTLVAAPEGHPHKALRVGQVTDDTGQTLATLHAYTQEGQVSAESIARELLLWADSAGETLPLVLGPSTRQALDGLRRGEDPRRTGRNGKTNGAAYRAVAAGLMNIRHVDRVMDQVVEICLPTHGTSVAISGAAAVAFAVIAAAGEGPTLEDILLAARLGAIRGREFGVWMWGTPLDKRIELAYELVKHAKDPRSGLSAIYNYIGTDMLVAESVAAAFGVVALAQGDPMKAVVFGANIGGDTDTIAAIAGAICGSWSGIDAIDRVMLGEIERVNQIDLRQEASRVEAIAEYRG
jgi:ADP-ribosylglycohydrolase